MHSSEGFKAEGLVVEGIEFPPSVTSPVSSINLSLAGAGVRSIQINPELSIKVTCLGLYLDPQALGHIAGKYAGKLSEELASDEQFYCDIITAPFEKLAKVTMLKPLPGAEFSRKVMENTRAVLEEEAGGAVGPEEENAIQEFHELCKEQLFAPGGGPMFLFTQAGLSLAFSQNHAEATPVDAFTGVFGGLRFAQAILTTMIGKTSVTPATKVSIAQSLSKAL